MARALRALPTDTPPNYRAAWGRWVAERLDMLAGPIAGLRIEIHAGKPYIDAVAGELESKGAEVVNPLDGLSMGQRLSWYNHQVADTPASPSPNRPPPAGTEGSADFVSLLLDRANAVTPAEFLAGPRQDLGGPGLYSWWVDEAGAVDLSHGVEIAVEPGLIYAGLAGATRWPSGRRSTNTLWSRIAALSTWMDAHIVVVAAPVEDGDTLGRLESEVLEAIDPLFNLQGMVTTPLRARISELRRAYGGG